MRKPPTITPVSYTHLDVYKRQEYTAKQVRKAERPSVLEKLQHFKSLIQAAVVDRTKRKELER